MDRRTKYVQKQMKLKRCVTCGLPQFMDKPYCVAHYITRRFVQMRLFEPGGNVSYQYFKWKVVDVLVNRLRLAKRNRIGKYGAWTEVYPLMLALTRGRWTKANVERASRWLFRMDRRVR